MFAGINPFSNFTNIYIERKEEARRGGIAFFGSTELARKWRKILSTDSNFRTESSSWINIPSYSKLANVLKMGTLPTRLSICSFQDQNNLIEQSMDQGPVARSMVSVKQR